MIPAKSLWILLVAIVLDTSGLVPFAVAADKTPPATPTGDPLPGLVPAPARIAGVGRWQLAHKAPRGRIYAIAWSPDGKKIAYSESASVRICDARTFDALQILVGHTSRVTSIDWNRANNRIASASFDGTVRIWSGDGVPEKVLKGHIGNVNGVAWTKDGHQLASVGSDSMIRVWSDTGTPVRTIDATAPLTCVAWSPDGARLAIGDEDRQVKIWNVDGRLEHTCQGHLAPVATVAWSPNGKRLASGSITYQPPIADADGVSDVRIWNNDGSESGSMTGDESNYGLQWTPNGEYLITTHKQGTLHFLQPNGEVKDVRRLARVDGLSKLPISISPSGEEIAIGGAGAISVIPMKDDGAGRSMPPQFQINRRYVTVVAMSPDRSRVLLQLTGAQGRPTFWNLVTGFHIEVPSDILRIAPTDDSFSPSGDRIVYARGDNQLAIWQPEGASGSGGARNDAVTRSERPIVASAWSPIDDRLAYCDDAGTVHIVRADGANETLLRPTESWSANSDGSPLQAHIRWSGDAQAIFVVREMRIEVRRLDQSAAIVFNFNTPFEQFWITPDLRQAAATHEVQMEHHTVSLCSAGATAKTVGDVSTGIDSLDCSPDLSRLVIGYTTGRWEMRRLTDLKAEPDDSAAHIDTIMTIAFSPDGKRFATGGWDSLIKIWRLDGTLERMFVGNTHPLFKLWWSRDGKWLLSTARDGTVCRWSAADGRIDSLLYLTAPGVFLHIPHDGHIAASDAVNAGEDLIALVERPSGTMEIVEYADFLKRLKEKTR